MPYNDVISRTDASALIPEQVSAEILANLANESAALSLFRSVPMSTNQTRMPVLAALPTAYFVTGDTGLKQTTDVNWDNKYLNVEELAAICPIPEAVLDDTSYDVWGAVRPLMEQAIGRALDAAVFFGTNKPSSWPSAIVTAVNAMGTPPKVTRGTASAAAGGIAEDFNDVFSFVEQSGFDVNGIVANVAYKGHLRGARNGDGDQLPEVNPSSVYGVDIRYPMRGQWPTGSGAASAILGDFMQGIVGTRQDFTYKVLDQAVITDSDGNIVYNLAQQDMVALRIVFRCAFQVANTITYDEETEADRYPFAMLVES